MAAWQTEMLSEHLKPEQWKQMRKVKDEDDVKELKTSSVRCCMVTMPLKCDSTGLQESVWCPCAKEEAGVRE